MTEAIGLTAPLDQLRKDAGFVLFSAPSEEVLLYPNIEWSSDGRLAFLSQDNAGQLKIIIAGPAPESVGTSAASRPNELTSQASIPRSSRWRSSISSQAASRSTWFPRCPKNPNSSSFLGGRHTSNTKLKA